MHYACALLVLILAVTSIFGQTPAPPKPVLYVIGTSHLDSQWNWTVQDSIRKFVPNTFFENFALFEKYPSYTFSYEGAIHYMWFKEYYPEAWPTVQKYVAEGRWRVAGNWINAVDVNVPSPESLMRHALYAKQFFQQEFGKVGRDVYLPDSFGFGYALPSIAAHSGLATFTTQKLTWGSSYGIPFPIGRWKGTDGSEVLAALNPGDYVTKIRSDIAVDPKWSSDLTTIDGGRQIAYKLFGVGDIGGAPDAESVQWLEKAIENKDGKVQVRNVSVDQLARDLTAADVAKLPLYDGELTMIMHGVGTYTSQAYMKRLNRQNELLADSAERAAVAASLLSGAAYPNARLREAWLRVLWHQFHDDLTGTCIPQAYQFSWNDELVSANQFAHVLTSSTSAVASTLNTQGTGIPLVVYNPLAMNRTEAVEATVEFAAPPNSIHVMDGDRPTPSQLLQIDGNRARILFIADVLSVGFKVYHVRTSAAPAVTTNALLKASTSSLENARYAVRFNANGDISSVLDKDVNKELLAGPIRLEMRDDPSPDKPAWRILYSTITAPVREEPTSPVIRVVENGPVRATVDITRKAGASTITQRVSLTLGGDRVDVQNLIDWKSTNTLLKAAFPLAASNPKATYDLGLGTIQRGNNTPEHYEVPAQQWADLTDAGGMFGAAILNDGKYGWDKPSDNVLRLTLLHTALPKASPYQGSNDLGSHRFTYSIGGHRGDWRAGRVPTRASQLNQPMIAFQTTPHSGQAKSVSLLSLADPNGQVAVRALKGIEKEGSQEIVVRLQELYGSPVSTKLTLPSGTESVREINAAEETVGSAVESAAGFSVDLKPYQPRSFALTVRHAAPQRFQAAQLDLPFNLDGVSLHTNTADGDFDGSKQTLAGELLPQTLQLNGIPFKFASSAPGVRNVLVPQGQTIALPQGTFNKAVIIAAAVGGDVPTTFGSTSVLVREWQGPVGQWNSRLKDMSMLRETIVPEMRGQAWTPEAVQAGMVVRFDAVTGAVSGIDDIRPGFVKRDEIAWAGTHRNGPEGMQVYIPSYLFAYTINLPPGSREIRLPSESRVRILAITALNEANSVKPATVLYSPELGPEGR
jgi:alpha-mannosidase